MYSLHWLDYAIFGLIMAITVGIGILFATTGGRQRTTEEYFTGNRKLGVIPAALSIVVSYMSAIMIIGVPAEAYLYGGQFLVTSIGNFAGTILAMLFVVPVLYPLKLVSVNSYLKMRYDSDAAKLFGTFSSVLSSIVYAAIVIYAPCTSVSVFTGVPVWTIILISSAIAIFYTTIGGIKAVVWTDAFLCLCMIGGMVAILVQGVRYAGGFEAALEIAVEGGRLDLIDFGWNPAIRYSIWAMIIGGTVDACSLYGTNQGSVQRYSNVESLAKARITLVIATIGNAFMIILPVLAGVAMYAYYKSKGCDPLESGLLKSPNELVPHFVMETLGYPGVTGIFISSITAGALSSVSSSLNAAAANTWDDILKHKLPHASASRASCLSKLLVVVYGLISTALCFVFIYVGGTVYQLSFSIMSTITIPVVGMFYAAICCPWMNTKGLLVGGICGFGFISWVLIGQYFTEVYSRTTLPTSTTNCTFIDNANSTDFTTPYLSSFSTEYYQNTTQNPVHVDDTTGFSINQIYYISYLWYRTFGSIICIVVGSIVSLFTGHRKIKDIQKRLLCVCYKPCAGENEQEVEEEEEVMLENMRPSWA